MDPEQKKRSMRSITYGVYVLTAKSGEDYAGATVTWMTQASMDPPKIMLGLKKGSKTAGMVKEVGAFALNILSKSQKDIAKAFLKSASIKDNRINGYTFKTEHSSAPILNDALSYIECNVETIIEGTDHDVVIAEVINAGIQSEEEPLVLGNTGWSYGG